VVAFLTDGRTFGQRVPTNGNQMPFPCCGMQISGMEVPSIVKCSKGLLIDLKLAFALYTSITCKQKDITELQGNSICMGIFHLKF